MRGAANAQRQGSDAIEIIAQDGTYAQNENIKWNILSNCPSWLTQNSDGTFTLKGGAKYVISYHFTPSTADGGISGIGYANAAAWKSAGYTTYYDRRTSGDVTLSLYNNGVSNTFVWFRMVIQRMGGGLRLFLARLVHFSRRC